MAPAGQARPEWDIIDDLMTRMHWRSPLFAGLGVLRKALRPFGRSVTPRAMIDGIIRLSEGGDRFGLRRAGLTLRSPDRQHPHGVVLQPHIWTTADLGQAVVYRAQANSSDP